MLSEHLRQRLEQWVTEFLAGATPGNSICQVVAELHALPLYSDIGGTALLSPDGQVWELAWDADRPKLTDKRWRILALVNGAERFPELRELLPVPREPAPVCPACQGAGRFSFPPATDSRVLCFQCAGLGWLPESWD